MTLTRNLGGSGEGFERRHSETSVPQPSSMNADLELPHQHYAIMYVDENGKTQIQASPSIAGCGGAIFTPEVTNRFMEMTGPNGQQSPRYNSNINQMPSSSWNLPANSEWMYSGQQQPIELIPCEWQSHQTRRKRRDIKRVGMGMSPPKSTSPTPAPAAGQTVIRVDDRSMLRLYYKKAFEEFQQLNCRSIAKSYIKLVEPRKQVHFPYNGKTTLGGKSQSFDPEMTKPAWWPVGVVHKEPDHLLKDGRVLLLVHILCELMDSHGITVEKLREASQEARRHINPAHRLEVLDEIYYVRSMEERYLRGEIDGSKLIQVEKAHPRREELSTEKLPTGPCVARSRTRVSAKEPPPGDSPVDDRDSMASSHSQEVPLTPSTSESNGSLSPGNGLHPYSMGMLPTGMPHGDQANLRQTAPDQHYFRGYFHPQYPQAEKQPVYWPDMPPSLPFEY